MGIRVGAGLRDPEATSAGDERGSDAILGACRHVVCRFALGTVVHIDTEGVGGDLKGRHVARRGARPPPGPPIDHFRF